jgi:hypothetical protein
MERANGDAGKISTLFDRSYYIDMANAPTCQFDDIGQGS